MPRYALTDLETSPPSTQPLPTVCDVSERSRLSRGRRLEIEIAGVRHEAELLCEGNPCLVLVNHRPVEVLETEGRFRVLRHGQTFEEKQTRNTRQTAPHSSGTVLAPMPGKVVRVLCQVGNTVEVGAPLIVLEAMKMENELRATRNGRVTAVLVTEGQAVESRAKLVELG